jgi:hypothetical protein
MIRYADFYFGTRVTDQAFVLDFEAASVIYSIRVPYGRWSPKAMRAVLETNILAQSGIACIVSFNYSTRRYRLDFDSTVEILGATGPNAGVSILPVLGFDTIDQTGTQFTGTSQASLKFSPNFVLNPFQDKVNTLELLGGRFQESVSGRSEVVSFGERRFYRFGTRYITDKVLDGSSYIKTNTQAVNQARSFLEHVLKLSTIDLILDRTKISNTFDFEPDDIIRRNLGNASFTVIELNEMVGEGLQGFYSIDPLQYDIATFSPLADTSPDEIARLLQENSDLILQENGGGILL